MTAHDIETKPVAELKRALGEVHDFADDRELLANSLDRVVLSTAGIELHLRRTESDV